MTPERKAGGCPACGGPLDICLVKQAGVGETGWTEACASCGLPVALWARWRKMKADAARWRTRTLVDAVIATRRRREAEGGKRG